VCAATALISGRTVGVLVAYFCESSSRRASATPFLRLLPVGSMKLAGGASGPRVGSRVISSMVGSGWALGVVLGRLRLAICRP